MGCGEKLILMAKTFSILSINSGIGVHLAAYKPLGGDVKLVLEPRKAQADNFRANQNINLQEIDSRWFYNRKENGLRDLVEELGTADIDVLDATSELGRYEEGKPQNLYDPFGIARRLKPKVVIAYCPSHVIADSNFQRFQAHLDYLRFYREFRDYFAEVVTLNALDFGASVNKPYAVTLAIREDIAKSQGIQSDAQIKELLTKLRGSKTSKAFDWEVSSQSESDYWLKKTLPQRELFLSGRLLKTSSKQLERLKDLGVRSVEEAGIPKAAMDRVIRASKSQPIPDPQRFSVLHPDKSRLLSLSEIKQAYGIEPDWRMTGSDIAMVDLIKVAVVPAITKAVISGIVKPALGGKLKSNAKKDPVTSRVMAAESLLISGEGVRRYRLETDYGKKYASSLEAKDTPNKGSPAFEDIDYIFDANEIGQDFIVEGPYSEIEGRRIILGAIRRNCFSDEQKKRFKKTIKSIRSKSEVRLKIATQPISKEMIERYEKRGTEYRLLEGGTQIQIRTKAGHWDKRPRTNPLPASTVGWMPDKNTGVPKYAMGDELDKNKKADFAELNEIAESAYFKLAPDDFIKQRTFMKSRIPPHCALGGSVFTTLSVNRYGDEMPDMGYHVDSGDDNSGLTTITVFDDGSYTGGYFVIPRFRVAFRVGNGDVFVSNSRETHGVMGIQGEGQRLSVVSYTKTTLGYKAQLDRAYPASSPRPKFRIDSFRVAVDATGIGAKDVKKYSLKTLAALGVEPKRITVFTNEKAELGELEKLDCAAVVYAKNTQQLWAGFKENTPLVHVKGDLKSLKSVEKVAFLNDDDTEENVITELNLGELTSFYDGFVYPAFHIMRELNCYLAAIQGEDRAIRVSELGFVPSLSAAIVRHDPELFGGSNLAETHFKKDRRTVRLGMFKPEFENTRLPKLVYLIGAPGTGKTEVIRQLMKGKPWKKKRATELLDSHISGDMRVLGLYSEKEVFAGTDKLSMAVSPKAVDWIKSQPTEFIIGEGDRLNNREFFEAAETFGELEIIELTVSEKERARRYKARGSNQSEEFIQRVLTKCENIRREFTVKKMPCEKKSDAKKIADYISNQYQVWVGLKFK